MGSIAGIVSPRPGQLRWADLRAEAGPDVEEVEVTVFTKQQLPVCAKVKLTRRWAGGGWQRVLACPRCHGPCFVLKVFDGQLLCARCRPARRVRDHEHKNNWWNKQDGQAEDELTRLLSRGSYRPEVMERALELSREVMRRDSVRVSQAEDEARAVLDGLSELP